MNFAKRLVNFKKRAIIKLAINRVPVEANCTEDKFFRKFGKKVICMYQIGQLVVHPMHGAGVIDAVITERVGGTEQEYYVFRIPVGGLILKIPVAKADSIGVRDVMGKERAMELLDGFSTVEVDATANWSKRYRDNLVRVKSGDLDEVVRVIKSLMLREHERGLSTGERKMLHNAKQIFITEVGLATDMEYDKVDSIVNASVKDAIGAM